MTGQGASRNDELNPANWRYVCPVCGKPYREPGKCKGEIRGPHGGRRTSHLPTKVVVASVGGSK